MTLDERRDLLASLKAGDIILVKHGRGTMRAKVTQTSHVFMAEKLPKSGRYMPPSRIGLFDVISKEATQ